MKLTSDEIKEGREQVLAALDDNHDDPYKPFKRALRDGKRVRLTGMPWRGGEEYFQWCKPPGMYEIEVNPSLNLYCDHTAEQWQFVIDGNFYVERRDVHGRREVEGFKCELSGFHPDSEYPFEYADHKMSRICHIVRKQNYPQPSFGRKIEDNDFLLIGCNHGEITCYGDEEIPWDSVPWFINLTRDG